MDLYVSRQPVFDLLSKNTFVIPQYQREYAWDKERCSILWDDLIQFYKENNEKGRDYFLGSIVCYEEETNDTGKILNVIDGQQRITTLSLLLKALYRKLENMKGNCSKADEASINGQQSSIRPCLWQINGITKEPSFDQPRITTCVYTNLEYNKHLQKVLSDCDLYDDGDFDTQYKYVQNYNFFIKKIDELSFEELGIEGSLFKFIHCLEKFCVLLPITCKDFEMGLTIFQTLNDRGMPLSDADIFKQQLYKNHKEAKDRKTFIQRWSNINEICNDGNIKIEIVDLFKYYMHIIRAKNKKTDNIKALRPFYLKDHQNYFLQDKNKFMQDIEHQAILWSAIRNEFPDDDAYAQRFQNVDENTKKYLQILNEYPNEWWQNIVSVLWHKYDGKKLNTSLRKVVATLYFLFLKYRSVVSIKPRAYVINNNIFHDNDSLLQNVFNAEEITKEAITKVITNFIEERAEGRVIRGLLILYAYLNKDQEHIPYIGNYQSEHILPKKWQDTNYNGWTKEKADKYIESIGNKVILGQKLNIQAGNEYFNRKKEKYRISTIHELRSLSENNSQKDWVPTDIEAREKKMADTFIEFFLDEFSKP